jgi:3' exoribonuclease, RNase T-like
MKYWYDTEFIEDGQTIDLISIGIVAEDGREFYFANKDCDYSKASAWVKENVLVHLDSSPINAVPVSKAWIYHALLEFCDIDKYGKPEFWGYYSAYDHVALCQIFGTMMDLPKGWPMYTKDIKQLCDSLGNPQLPEQGKNEHHALADARWNKQAYDFLVARIK